MITPTRGDASSTLLGGLPDGLVAARVPVADPETYRAHLADAEWQAALAFDGKRRIEHVAGRAAARVALTALVGECAAIVARGDDGAPHIVGLADAPLVSITHGRRAAVA